MRKLGFRNADVLQVLLHRQWIRENIDNGTGEVFEDLDLMIRMYGPRYNTDSKGKLALVELKHGKTTLTNGQKWTFGLLDDLCKKGDPAGERYKGFYLLQYSNEDWSKCMFHVNDVRLFARDDLEKFLTLEEKTLDRINRDGKNPFKM